MTQKERFIKEHRRKYYGEKRLGKIFEKAKKYVKKIGKEERKYTTLDEEGKIIETHYSVYHETKKYAEEYLSIKQSSELYGYQLGKKKTKSPNYAKYYKYRKRLTLKKEGGQLENFIERYGTEIYEGKSINSYLDDFREGKISQQELNNIINLFKKNNKTYKANQDKRAGYYK